MPSDCLASSSPTQLTTGLTMPPLLAPELHFLIIQHVDDNTDLCLLALCCSAFRDEAQRRLFRDVALTTPDQEQQFLSAIKSTPLRLEPLVHSFHVGKWDSDNARDTASLSTALQAMCELKHLKLDSWDPSIILHADAFQLRTFVCSIYLEGPTQVLFLLCEFLPAQKDIKCLEIYYGGNPINLSNPPTGICPQLEFLSTNSTKITRVLLADTGLISEFRWRKFHTHPPLTVRQLNHLKSLLLCTHLRRMDTSFIAHLTSLVNLTLFEYKTTTEQLLDTVSELFCPSVPDLMLISTLMTGSLSARYSPSSIPSSGPSASTFTDGERQLL